MDGRTRLDNLGEYPLQVTISLRREDPDLQTWCKWFRQKGIPYKLKSEGCNRFSLWRRLTEEEVVGILNKTLMVEKSHLREVRNNENPRTPLSSPVVNITNYGTINAN